MLVAYAVAGFGVVVLVVVLLVVRARVRRFSVAAQRARGGLRRGVGDLPAVRGARG